MNRVAALFAAIGLSATPALAQSGDPINLNNMQYGEVASSLVTYNPRDARGTAAFYERRAFGSGNTLPTCIRDAYAAAVAGGTASVICRLTNGQNAVARCAIEGAYDREPVCRWVNRP